MSAQFFADVLPRTEGVIVLGDGRSGPAVQRTADGLTDIVARVLHAGNTPGRDFYFAPARYRLTPDVDPNDNYKGLRTAANCVAKRCVAFDVDLNHEKKPSYTSKPQALGAMLLLCKTMALPTPSYCVDSGRGLHFYWALGEDIPAHEWKRVMDALKPKLLARDEKLFCDPTRMADLAGYLRLPGSWNTKSGTRVKFFTKPQGNAAWSAFTAAAGVAAALPAAIASAAPALSRPRRAASAGMSGAEPTISDPAALLTRCGPLRELANAHEKQDYEAWFAAARLFARSVDTEAGRAAFHEFSKRHATYTPESADSKYTDAVASTRASPSCQQLRDMAGRGTSLCQDCPMFRRQDNGKPAALVDEFPAAQPPAKPAAVPNDSRAIALIRRAMRGDWVDASAARIALPAVVDAAPPTQKDGLFLKKNGALCHRQIVPQEDGGVEFNDTLVAKGPIWVYSQTRVTDENGNARYGVRMASARQVDDQWQVKTYVVSAEAFATRGKLHAELVMMKAGVLGSDPNSRAWRLMYETLFEQQSYAREEDARDIVSRCGWFDPTLPDRRRFVIGDRCYYPDGAVHIVDTTGGADSAAKNMGEEGTLEESIEIFRSAMSKCSTSGKIILLASLGTPLVRANAIRGAMFYIYGRSGAGKTLLTSVAQSFYTAPGIDVMASGRDTAASLMHLLGYASALPFFLDEATSMRPEDLSGLMLDVTGGRERNRLKSSSNEVREVNTWETIVFATSNKPLSQLGGTAQGEAQLARTIGVNVDVYPLYNGNQLPIEEARAATRNYGKLGAHFVQYVLKNYDAVMARVKEISDSLADTSTALGRADKGDVRRVWRMAAAVVLATAELVSGPLQFMENEMGLLDKIAKQLTHAADFQHQIQHTDAVSLAAAPPTVTADGEAVMPKAMANDPVLMRYMEDVLRRGAASVYAVYDKDGSPASGDELVRMLSNTGLIHEPQNVECMQLHVTIGSAEVIGVIPIGVFRAWCSRQKREIGVEIDPVHATAGMRERGFIVPDTVPAGASSTKLPAHRDSVATATTAMLPQAGLLRVRLILSAPATADMRLAWA